jgi:geranylgeranyl diphosphate synthase type II
MDFKSIYNEKLKYINNGLDQILKKPMNCPPVILSAMDYSLSAGGKRLRPILFLSAFELASEVVSTKEDTDEVLPMACALEMIHTYSLIHDDLPAMDNDDYRRGKPTNHKVFGEAMAILAGDGLLNLAYEIMLNNAPLESGKLPRYLKAMSVIASSAGISGMIGGQVADIQSENTDSSQLDENIIDYIHTHKTEALITASLKSAALIGTEDSNIINALTLYGQAFGLAFQITDDILDVTGNLDDLGKSPGSDAKKGKLTYPSRFGLEASKKLARQQIEQAVLSLEGFGSKGEFMRQLAISMLDRNQ